MKFKIELLAFCLVMFSNHSFAIDGKFSGLLFGDIYWMADNNNVKLRDANGLWIRRVYLTYDAQIVDKVDTRLRLELNSPGDFTSATNITPFLKDAYLRWKPSDHAVLVGLMPTQAFDLFDNMWGYRMIEKSPTDLAQMGSARDLGVAVTGPILKNQILKYHVMVGNGSGTKAETNTSKRGYAALTFTPVDMWTFQAFGDFESTNMYFLQGLLMYTPKWGKVGALLGHQSRTGPTLTLHVLSGFGVVNLSEMVRIVARADRMFEPNPTGNTISYLPFNTAARSLLIIGGVDCEPWTNVHFIPNAGTILYDVDAGSIAPSTDLIARLTFSAQF